MTRRRLRLWWVQSSTWKVQREERVELFAIPRHQRPFVATNIDTRPKPQAFDPGNFVGIRQSARARASNIG